MRRLGVLITCMLLTAVTVLAQSPDSLWSRTIGTAEDERFFDAVIAHDGGIVGAGTKYYESNDRDFYLAKIDAFGTYQWDRAYGSAEYESCYGVALTSTNGFALGGYTYNYGGPAEFWQYRTDANGNAVGHDHYGGAHIEDCKAIQSLPDGGFIMAGWSRSYTVDNNTEGYAVRTNSTGDTVWTRTYGTIGSEWFEDVVPLSDGNILFAGTTTNYGTNDFWMVKTDANGTMLWTKHYGDDTYDEECYAIQPTSDGGYLMAGFEEFTTMGGYYNSWLLKAYANGDSAWSKSYGGAQNEKTFDIEPTSDGGYMLGGYTGSYGAGGYDFWTLKINASGDSLWSVTHGGAEDDAMYAVKETDDGGYFLVGTTFSFGAGLGDGWIVKIGEPVEYDLTVHYEAIPILGHHIVLRWNVPQIGDYEIYSTTDPNLTTEPPGTGWDLEEMLFGLPPGETYWEDLDAMGSDELEQRRYVVVPFNF